MFAIEAKKAWKEFKDPGPVVLGSTQYASCFGAEYEIAFNIDRALRLPYMKDWISQHPQGRNLNSILLCGFGKSLNRIIHISSLAGIYQDYKEKFFPKLLDNPNVLPEDKQKIKELLKKPWNYQKAFFAN